MANKKINELSTRTPSLTDLLLVGDPSSGYSYKCTVTALATIIETDIADGYVTIGTTQTISGAKTFSNNLTLTSVSNANTDTDKFLVLNGSNVVNYRTGAEVLSDIGGQGALTLTTTGSSGASTLVGNTLNIPTYTLSGLGGISGSGSTGYLPKFTGTTSIGNSIVQDNGSTLNIAGGIICNAISASSLTSDQYIAFQNINTSYSLSGYTMLYATLTNPGFIFNFGDGTRSAIFRYAAGSYTYTLPSATGTLALTSDITSSISGTANYIPKFTGSNSIGNSVIYESSSNIGIGTISPAQKLEVAGTLRVRSATEILDISAPVGKIDFNNVSGDPLGFSIGGSEKMRLDASGNLGIGVTPSAFSGINAIQLPAYGALTFNADGHITSNAYFNSGWKYIGSGAATLYNHSSGAHIWQTAPSGTAGNAISFTQAMTLDASGRLGIGTTSPLSKLQVLASNGSQIAIDYGGSSINYYDANTQIFRNASYTEFMRINSSGNVGIGTTSPSTKLEVVTSTTDYTHTIIAKNTSSVVGAIVSTQFRPDNGSNGLIIGIHPTGYAEQNLAFINQEKNAPLVIYTNNTERMRITSGGLVLIGTTSTSGVDRVRVNNDGTTSYSTVNITNANSTANMYVGVGGSAVLNTSLQNNAYVWNAAASALVLGTSDTERMRITSGGDVLVNATSNTLNGKLASALNDNGYAISALKQGTFGAGILVRVDNINSDLIRFFYSSSNTQVGSISTDGTNTTYNTSSDYRLKQDLKVFNGLSLIDSIKVYDYQWKSDSTRAYGVLAHELQSVIPYAVTGIKDGEQMQGVDYSKLTPILLQAIKELKAEIEILKNK